MDSDENQEKPNKFSFTLSGVIFVALMSGLNVGIDLLLSSPLKAIFPHVIVGMFLMVPLDLVFIGLSKFVVKKHWTSTLFLFVFSALSIPTTMFGAVPGIYKLVVGLAIGILLDIAFLPRKNYLKILIGGIIGSIFWWLALFTVWQLLYPPNEVNMVFAFSNMLNGASPLYAAKNGVIDLSGFVTLPITALGFEFLKFCLIIGLLSAIPCIIGVLAGYGLYKSIEKTAIYEKFEMMQ